MSALSRFGPSVQAIRSSNLFLQPATRHMASASTANDPVQKLFVDKIREFKNSNKGLDEAHQKAIKEDLVRLKRVHRIEDENKLASLDFKFSNEHQVSLHDLDTSKEKREQIHSGEYLKQLTAQPQEPSALMASIPPQVTLDMHLPPFNKPDPALVLEDNQVPIPFRASGYKPDYESTDENVTAEKLERDMMIEFGKDMPTINDEKAPERDTVNFPRIAQPLDTPPARYHFIPESWFQFFYPKTGVTGPYAFAGSFATFLLSKEWLIWEHELLTGVTSTMIFTYAVLKFGPKVGPFFRKKIKEEVDNWENWRKGNYQFLDEMQTHYKSELNKSNLINAVYDVRRQDVDMQLEGEYRRRIKNVYEDTRRRLDYLVAVAHSQRQIAHKNMVNWIIGNVESSIGQKQESELLDSCIMNLKQLGAKNANAV